MSCPTNIEEVQNKSADEKTSAENTFTSLHKEFHPQNWKDYLPKTFFVKPKEEPNKKQKEKRALQNFEKSGILLIHKPEHISSADVIRFLKQIARFKKIGHAGTLDPFASGLLLILINRATRLSEKLMADKKIYSGKFSLGISSDSQDITGTLTQHEVEHFPSPQDVQTQSQKFCGKILQTPPLYSARKVKGKALYRYAREGKTVARQAKEIEVFSFETQAEKPPQDFFYCIECGKGTYVRTLVHDLGNSLGCGAVVTSLCRKQIGDFTLANAYALSQLQTFEQIEKAITFQESL